MLINFNAACNGMLRTALIESSSFMMASTGYTTIPAYPSLKMSVNKGKSILKLFMTSVKSCPGI